MNIRGIRANLDLFVAELLQPESDIIVFSESWTYSFNEGLFKIAGFRGFFRSNDGYRAGGVAVFVRQNITATRARDYRVNNCDALTVDLSMGRTRLSVTAVYRSPSESVSDFLTFIEDDLPTITSNMSPTADCLIIGDMNINIADSNPLTTRYLDYMSSEGYECLNDRVPTRSLGSSHSNIDHVFGRFRSFQSSEIEVLNSHGISDHKLINLELKGAPARPRLDMGKIFRRTDYIKTTAFLEELDWAEFHSTEDPDRRASLLQERCMEAMEYGTTSRPITSRFCPLKVWMNPGLVKAIRKRRNLYRRRKRVGSMETKICYEAYNRWLRRALRGTKDAFYRGKLQQNDGDYKGAWRYVNSYIRGQAGRDLLQPDVVDATVEDVNTYFANLGSTTVASAIDSVDTHRELPDWHPAFFSAFYVPSISQVTEEIHEIDERKSAGVDGISGAFVRAGSHVLAPLLRALIESIVRTSTFPRIFKTALLYPIHKAGSVTDMASFRPISLLSTINRIVEKFLADQLYAAIEERCLLSPMQFGFRRGRNCEQAAHYLVSSATEALERRQVRLSIR